jgi:hypothetical protein
MLDLPSSQVLLTTGSDNLWVYTPQGSPQTSWQPVIQTVSNNGNSSYTLTGTQLNGISEGAAYGDDAEMSTNYPIVRLTASNGNVYYARTYNWSNTGVATGSTPETVNFTLPAGIPTGTYSLSSIANGIASSAVSFTVGLGPVAGQVPGPANPAAPASVTVAVPPPSTTLAAAATTAASNFGTLAAPAQLATRGTAEFVDSTAVPAAIFTLPDFSAGPRGQQAPASLNSSPLPENEAPASFLVSFLPRSASAPTAPSGGANTHAMEDLGQDDTVSSASSEQAAVAEKTFATSP